MIGEVKVMVIEDTATRKAFSFDSASGIKFPFGLCEVDGEVHFSDHLRYSIYKINFSEPTKFHQVCDRGVFRMPYSSTESC